MADRSKRSIWGYRLISLLLAVFIWCYVTISDNPIGEQQYTVNVEARNLAADLTVEVPTVRLRVQGNLKTLQSLYARDIVAYVDCSGLGMGEHSLPVKVELPGEFTLVSANPDPLTVSIAAVDKASFNIKARISGKPASGYSQLDAVLTPSVVSLSGTKDDLAQVKNVYVAADISGLDHSYNETLNIVVENAAGVDITSSFVVSPTATELLVPIVNYQPEKTVAVDVPVTGRVAEGYRLSYVVVNPTTVKLMGSLDALNSVSVVTTDIVNVSDLNKTTSRVLPLTLPENVTSTVKEVTVIIQIDPIAKRTFSFKEIIGGNLGEDLEFKLNTAPIKLVFSGTDEVLNSLTEEDILVYVDCQGLTAGNYELPIQVVQPSMLDLISIEPKEAAITLIDIAPEPAPEPEPEPEPDEEPEEDPDADLDADTDADAEGDGDVTQ